MAHKSPFRTVGNFKLSDFKILKLTFTKGICKLMMEACKIMIGYQPPIMNNVFVLRDTHNIRNLQIISNEKKLSKLWVQNISDTTPLLWVNVPAEYKVGRIKKAELAFVGYATYAIKILGITKMKLLF